MKSKLLLFVFLFNLLSIIACKKQDPVSMEEEPFPAIGEYPKQLTQGDHSDGSASFSPDGKYIAFYSLRYLQTELAWCPFELWVMKKDGFDQHRLILVESIFKVTFPTLINWASDSKSMIIHAQNGDSNYKSEIWRISITGEITKLYAPNLKLEKFTYSPDRSKISYIIQGPNPKTGSPIYKLYVANTDFSDSIRIDKGLIGNYVWQSNSKGLIYSFDDRPNGNFDLWKATIDGTSKLKFAEALKSEESFSGSSDGKYIAYSFSKSVYISSTEIFSPKIIMSDAIGPKWISDRNLLLVFKEQTEGNGSWSEPCIIDLQANIVRKLPKRVNVTSFYSDGHHFLYNLDGDIWLDYLP